jgi:hypothetical protein
MFAGPSLVTFNPMQWHCWVGGMSGAATLGDKINILNEIF